MTESETPGTRGRSTRNRRKILAIAAAGLVIGVGAAATLAAWNDNEWVVGGTGPDSPGIGTSQFEVSQNRDQSPTAGSTWSNHETEPVAGSLTFTIDPLALTPGDSIYAPVALQTTADSIAGTVTLQAPIESTAVTANDPTDILWGALQYSVKATETATDCDATTWATFGTSVATAQDFDAALTATTQPVAADRGNIQYYCFQVTLPAAPTGVTDLTTLQGLTVAPAWRFAAVSTTTP